MINDISEDIVVLLVQTVCCFLFSKALQCSSDSKHQIENGNFIIGQTAKRAPGLLLFAQEMKTKPNDCSRLNLEISKVVI